MDLTRPSDIVAGVSPTTDHNFLSSAVMDAWGPRSGKSIRVSLNPTEAPDSTAPVSDQGDQPLSNQEKETQLQEKITEAFGNKDLAQAQQCSRDLLKLQTEMYGKISDPVASTLSNLGFFANGQGQFELGEKYSLEAARIGEKLGKPGTVTMASALDNLADSYRGQQPAKIDQADQCYKKALTALDGNVPARDDTRKYSEHMSMTENVLKDYASFLKSQGRTSEATAMLERANTIQQDLRTNHSQHQH